jgi:bla regulator protein blaR1
MSPGRYSAVNVTLRLMLRQAYGVPDFRVSGGPSWIDVDRFDVEAKADEAAQGQAVNLMLRSLLEERFKVVAHSETRESPIYELILARSDGKLGSQLRKAGDECLPPTTPAGAPPAPPPPPGAGARGQCPSIQGPGVISGRKMTMARLSDALAGSVSRVVIDRTGLEGTFDLDLQWLPDQPRLGGPLGNGAGGFVPSQDLPSIFTAVQEQLGLKLDSQRGPVEIVVIERAEKPTED